MLNIENIKGGYMPPVSFEIQPMVTISQREYERLKTIEANSLAAVQTVMDSQKELRQKLKEMGF